MNILSFDIEEWFHILDNYSTQTHKDWIKYPKRIHENMQKIYNILDQTNSKATFFILGWIAEKYPEVVKEIHSRGHEIGSHSHYHQLVYSQKRKVFFNDIEKSIKTIEDLISTKVRMFRAPGFSITESNKWAFEVLYELGVEVDSSIFPATRAHGGMKKYGAAEPTILKYNGVTLKEFPINSFLFFSKPIIYSGGGYFRLFPYYLIKKFSKNSNYVMTYFHPRDFDPDQPIIKELSLLRRFKSYVGLNTSENKLKKWLCSSKFIDIGNAEKEIDWNNVQTINL